MSFRIIGAGIVGWAGIISLAWFLANDRIALCGNPIYHQGCVIRATSDRDFVLTFGLTVALVASVATALAWKSRYQFHRRGGSGAVRTSTIHLTSTPH